VALHLHFHPFSSYCQKVVIALYEAGTPFEGHEVNFGDPASRDAFRALWPIAKMPVLVDDARGRTVPEASIIIEYLDRHYPGPRPMIPADPGLALSTRLFDRVFDMHVNDQVGRIVGDRLRPEGKDDPSGVESAHAALRTAYGVIEARMTGRDWVNGSDFSLADCAAGPALFYADLVEPFGEALPNTTAYLARLNARPSFARAIAEAAYFMPYFPKPRGAS
jgi:glutathione S-transferase